MKNNAFSQSKMLKEAEFWGTSMIDEDIQFSKWYHWNERSAVFEGNNGPGVYILAIFSDGISCGQEFELVEGIDYIGMSNAAKGVASRLNKFDNAILGKGGHSGGTRFYKENPNYDSLVSKLYFSYFCYTQKSVSKKTPDDLRIMGKVANLEYICLAKYREKFDDLPLYNDPKRPPRTK